jgi:teichuronic acid biosynthesis glycosyltransferase TuaC
MPSQKILTFTTLYPNCTDANNGVFIQNRLLHFARAYQHEIRVVAPIPYFPRLKQFERWYRFACVPEHELIKGVSVSHRRYLVVPKIGMTCHGMSMFLGSLAEVRRLRSEFDFAAIDAHFFYPDAFAGVLLGKLLGKPVVASARGTDVHTYSQMPLIRPFLRYVGRNAAAVIAVSDSLKTLLVRLGVKAEKIRVIGNGVDLTRFRPDDMKLARQRLGLSPDGEIILSVARIEKVKGIHHLISAMKYVHQLRPSATLVVVGSQENRSYVQEIRNQIAQAELDGVVHLAGPQPHESLVDWYNACNLFCLCSSREGWPNALMEAMACGRPVVASRTGDIPAIVGSAACGITIDPSQAKMAADAIVRALDTNWDRQKISFYAQTFRWEDAAAAQQSVFQEVTHAPDSFSRGGFW